MADNLNTRWIDELTRRTNGHGGYAGLPGRNARADATCWAVLALRALDADPDLIDAGQANLASGQADDGRVSLGEQYPQAFWPTALAVLAWHRTPGYADNQQRAVRFLLDTTGRHHVNTTPEQCAHDTSIRGWPWIADTHSWVEPTSLVLHALEVTGHAGHERAKEARRMILNRQLPRGWNYGNTKTFGRQLRPMPESSGLALSVLAGKVGRQTVADSLEYLHDEYPAARTPLSLAWITLGLTAWGQRPDDAEQRMTGCLERRNAYGPHLTQHLGLLIVTRAARNGLTEFIAEGMDP